MLCQKCQKNQGVPYLFYYGKRIDQETTTINQYAGSNKLIRTTTTFRLGGKEKVVLCAKCLKVGIGFWVSIIGLFLIGILVSYGLSSFLYFLLISVLGPLVFHFAQPDLKTKGVKKAIELRKTDLMRQGFDTFWTPQEYKAQ